MAMAIPPEVRRASRLTIEKCANGFIVRPEQSDMGGFSVLNEVNVFESFERASEHMRKALDPKPPK